MGSNAATMCWKPVFDIALNLDVILILSYLDIRHPMEHDDNRGPPTVAAFWYLSKQTFFLHLTEPKLFLEYIGFQRA